MDVLVFSCGGPRNVAASIHEFGWYRYSACPGTSIGNDMNVLVSTAAPRNVAARIRGNNLQFIMMAACQGARLPAGRELLGPDRLDVADREDVVRLVEHAQARHRPAADPPCRPASTRCALGRVFPPGQDRLTPRLGLVAPARSKLSTAEFFN